MIDHVGFPISDYARSKAFYEKALAPLGYTLVMEVRQDTNDRIPAAGFGIGGKPDFWIGGKAASDKADAHRRLARRIAPRSMPSISAAHRGRRKGQRQTGAATALSRELLRGLRARPRRERRRRSGRHAPA